MLGRTIPFLLFLFSIIQQSILGLPPVIKIGGLFDSSQIDEINEKVFLRAIQQVNEEDLLEGTQLVGLTMKVPEHQSFQVQKSVCELISKGCVAIFGPRSPVTTPIVESVTDTKEIPLIQTRWTHGAVRGSCAVNLYPDADVLSNALVDVVRAAGWTHFTILYYDDDGLYRVKKLLEMYGNKGHSIVMRRLNDTSNFRPVLRRIKLSKETFILVDAPTDILHEVLKQAQQIGLMSSEQNFIVNNLDMHTVDLEPFKYSGTNISGIRMLNTSSPAFRKSIEDWSDGDLDFNPDTIRLETVLIYDGVFLLAQSLLNIPIEGDPTSVRVTRQDEGVSNNNDENGEGQEVAPDEDPVDGRDQFRQLGRDSPSTETVTCDNDIAWPHGFSIINDIKSSTLPRGLSGNIRFDHQGFRTNFMLELTNLTEQAVVGKGRWTPRERVRLLDHKVDGNFKKMNFRVVIALTPPYGMEKESPVPLTGNDRYEGYAVDLIHELSKLLGFNYTLEIQADNKQGNYDNVTKKWNGMIGKILYGEADLAITDLTITGQREEVVDFTMPFMNLGISILYKKPKKAPPELFSFLSPFSQGVWIYVIAAYIGVSVLLFLMGRISPYEWRNPYPCIEEPEELENQFSVSNAFWFTIGSLMQQGSDIAPIAVSTRMVAGIWWFFTLIMVSSYTANLAAFLTVEIPDSPFNDVEGLEAQTKIKYGAKAEGSTQNFFRDSKNEVYKRMWHYMETNYKDVMPASNEEGVNRVNDNDDYAYLMESTSIEYEIERKCNLTQIGGLLDQKGYGIAMQKNKWFRNQLNFYVLRLQEMGKLDALKDKWWKEKGAGSCQGDGNGGDGKAGLPLANVGGVFVVLVGGIIFAVFVAIAEMIYNLWKVSVKKKVSFRQEFLEEWEFISRCTGSVKPVRKYGGSNASMQRSDAGNEEMASPISVRSKSTSRQNLHLLRAAASLDSGLSNGGLPQSKNTSRTNLTTFVTEENRGNVNRSPKGGPRNVQIGHDTDIRSEIAQNKSNSHLPSIVATEYRPGMENTVGKPSLWGGSGSNEHMIGFEPIAATSEKGTMGKEKGKKQRRGDVRKSVVTDI